MSTLYDINAEIYEIMDLANREAEENDGEISDATSEALDTLQMERDEKIGNIGRYIKTLKALSKNCKEESQALAKRSKTIESRIDWLMEYVNMTLRGSKWTDGVVQFSYRKGVPKVEIVDESKIREEFWKIERTIKKAEIKKMIQSGGSVEGAKIVIGNDTLTIR